MSKFLKIKKKDNTEPLKIRQYVTAKCDKKNKVIKTRRKWIFSFCCADVNALASFTLLFLTRQKSTYHPPHFFPSFIIEDDQLGSIVGKIHASFVSQSSLLLKKKISHNDRGLCPLYILSYVLIQNLFQTLFPRK